MKTCELIVIGTGGVGTAALAATARRGVRAIGIDRFAPGHDRGSSHGQTRIIRQAYFEHPDYVPLLLEAYRLWHRLEHASGERLLEPVGLVEIGAADGAVVGGGLASAAAHGLAVERLTSHEIEQRFSGLRVPEALVGVFEPQAGYLRVERAVVAQADEAQRLGAEIRVGETVLAWRPTAHGVEVQTDCETYAAERLIISAGAWAGALLADLRIPLRVLRKQVQWFQAGGDEFRADRGMPTFLYDLPADLAPARTVDGDPSAATVRGHCFYGFPQIDERGVKVAEHSGGIAVDDPLQVDRAVDRIAERRLTDFCRAYLPRLTATPREHSVCFYTMTPDGHFVVDRHEAHPQVVFAAGLSGHGFKFVPILGEILADLALEGQTRWPIGFLSSRRPGLKTAPR